MPFKQATLRDIERCVRKAILDANHMHETSTVGMRSGSHHAVVMHAPKAVPYSGTFYPLYRITPGMKRQINTDIPHARDYSISEKVNISQARYKNAYCQYEALKPVKRPWWDYS